MSSNATAEVRTFPNAKVQPSTEAPEVPVQPAVPVAAPAEAPAKKKRSARSFLLPIIGLALLGAGSWYGYNYWTDGRFMISTDDAYVQADMSFVSPKISGYIDKVLVGENQKVKAGDPLFVIDNGDYKIAVAQAEAQIATLAKTLDRIDAQTKAAQASLSQAQAQKVADQAAADNAARAQDRAAQLLKTHVGTQAQLDDAQTALDQAKAALVGADAQIAAAQA
ncbi:MAG: HlyD family secretion protein, partial [Mesorhizobium sp.]